jgi:flagellar basal-body rod protein FlgF
MNYGMHISSSGALTSMARMDTLTNNLANVNTVGFKPQTPYTRQRDVVRIEDNLPNMDSNPLLEKLGAGVQLAPTSVDFSQGSLRDSGNPLDVGFAGEGFLTVESENSGDSAVFNLTRDGRLSLDSTGKLVMSSSGRPVLDTSNRPILLNGDGEVQIATDGTISQGGAEIAKLKLVDVPDKSKLQKAGQGMYTMHADALANLTAATGALKQGMVESSGVDEIKALMQVQSAAGDVRANLAMISYHDKLMDRAINRLGRVG